jgi:hypothetical protein
MRRMLFLLTISIGLIIISGCDKDSTKSEVGDDNDARFVLAKADIDSSLTEFNQDGVDGSGWFSGTPPLIKIVLDDSVAFDTSSYWHIYAGAFQGEPGSWTRIDSFRFTDTLGDFQRNHDEQTAIFEHRLHRLYNFANPQSGVNWIKTRYRNVIWDGFIDTTLVLTGNIQRSYTGQTPNWDFSHTMTGIYDSVKFRTEDFLNGLPTHPIAGQFTGTSEHNRQLANSLVHITTSFTATFYEDHYHVHIISGENYWDWDHYYII